MSVTFRPNALGVDLEAWGEGLLVNVSNSNAAFLLQALGLPTSDELCGETTGEDFLGRVLLATGPNPADEGVPALNLDPRVIDMGRRPGYLQERLEQLADVAQAARTRGGEVVWS